MAVQTVSSAGGSSLPSVSLLAGVEAVVFGSGGGGGGGLTSLTSNVLRKVSVVPIGMCANESKVCPRIVDLSSEFLYFTWYRCTCVCVCV